MIELRCRFKKAVEIDPVSLTIQYRCPTCSKLAGVDVIHEWPIERLLRIAQDSEGDVTIAPEQKHASEAA